MKSLFIIIPYPQLLCIVHKTMKEAKAESSSSLVCMLTNHVLHTKCTNTPDLYHKSELGEANPFGSIKSSSV